MQGNIFMRDDTFFGICEALGEDFGFNANWLRLAFGVSLLWNPAAVVGAYVALGLIVLVSRLIVRNPRRTVTAAQPPEPAAVAEAQPELPLAA